MIQKAMVGTWFYLGHFPSKSPLEMHGGLEYAEGGELFHC